MSSGFWILDFGFWIGSLARRGSWPDTSAGEIPKRKEDSRSPEKCPILITIQNPQSIIQNSRAFSLVEVTLAIGIVSFALLAVVALLPIGLQSVKNATEQAAAAEVLRALSAELRAASTADGTNFSGSFAGTNFAYRIGETTPVETVWTNLTLEGGTESEFSTRRLSAVVRIQPPTNAWSPGRATVSVAWSAQANPQWIATNQSWSRAEGSLVSGIQFLPRK